LRATAVLFDASTPWHSQCAVAVELKVNALSITIAREEIREIEAVAEPGRASVRHMFERYKPNHGNGDQGAKESISTSVQEKFANYRPDSGNGE
jgi:hypothetical protein